MVGCVIGKWLSACLTFHCVFIPSSPIHTHTHTVIEEQSVRLKLTVTDTPGFGDQINNDKWYGDRFWMMFVNQKFIFTLSCVCFCFSWVPILEYVNEQFDKYLNEEVSINRKKVIPDTRVHCCLYFIPPTGHR